MLHFLPTVNACSSFNSPLYWQKLTPLPYQDTCKWVLEKWVSDCCLTSTDEIHFYLTNTLSWICIVQSHLNNCPRVDMFPKTDTLSWSRVNQFLIFLLNVACLPENHQYQFNSLWFDPIGDRTHHLLHSRRTG
jgi:hypothetical protein